MPRPNRLLLALLIALLPTTWSCAPKAEGEATAEQQGAASDSRRQPELEDLLPATTLEMVGALLQPSKNDWEEMVEQRVIRVLVVSNRTSYFLDNGRARGIAADALHEWEKQLNQELKLGSRPMRVAAIPVPRDRIFPFLVEGRAEIAIASLTVTPERAAQVDFSTPVDADVAEIVVTGKNGPSITQLTDLSGLQVHVRRSSSFYESLQSVNAYLEEQKLAPIEIVAASEFLETEDLLEMVHVGLIPVTIADDYLAGFWQQVYPDLILHQDVAVATGRQIAWALRKNTPNLKKRVDAFVSANRKGSLLGNMLIKRYLRNAEYVDNALDREGRDRFNSMVHLFQKYGSEYEFDALMLAAQGYQESGLDQSVRSRVGAIGVMQVMPSTAADKSVNIKNIEILENNIQAGSKYMRHLINTYFADPEIDQLNKMLFSFAGYNAGPSRINRLRKEADAAGFDPNVWFDNVEVVVAQKVGREPVNYVSNIAKYYTAYTLIHAKNEARQRDKG